MATRKTTLAIAVSGLALAALLGWWWQRPKSNASPADTAPADAAPPWQVGRVTQALPLLQRLLGLPPEAVSSMENPPDVR